jgi:hypothetical protein
MDLDTEETLMQHWVYENMFVFILASISLFDIIKRVSTRVYTALIALPLMRYFRATMDFVLGRNQQMQPCRCDGRSK